MASDIVRLTMAQALVRYLCNGCGANVGGRADQGPGSDDLSRGEHRIPNLRCGFVFDAKLAQFELTLSDPMHEFDAGDRRCGSTEMLEAEHRTKPQLDRSVILFDQIVKVF
jgi:hypothetical protein